MPEVPSRNIFLEWQQLPRMPAGSIAAREGSLTCELCPPGKWTKEADHRSCEQCPAGSIVSNFSCTKCQLGSWPQQAFSHANRVKQVFIREKVPQTVINVLPAECQVQKVPLAESAMISSSFEEFPTNRTKLATSITWRFCFWHYLLLLRRVYASRA